MNNVKYRPVGSSKPIVVMVVSQKSRRHTTRGVQVRMNLAQTNRFMLNKGYVRV